MQLTRKVLTVGKLLKGVGDSRYEMNKLRIDPGKKYAEATNGHWLVRVPLESMPADELPKGYREVKDPISLDNEQTEKLLKGISRKPKNPLDGFQRCVAYSNEGDTQKISFSADTNGDTTSFELGTPGNWPDTGKAMPETKVKARVTVNAEYLVKLIQACQARDRDKINMVRIEFYGDEKPVRLIFPDGESETVALLMPVDENRA